MLTLSAGRRSRAVQPATSQVVCVDLDGTLVAGDLLWESFVELVKRRPWRALRALLSVLQGRASFKREVARLMPLDPAAVPYRENLLNELRHLHRQGVHVVLATAADDAYARAVANHLGIFADVVASDGHTNLSGSRKAGALVARYGERGFSYVGNDWEDVPVWQAASAGQAVAARPRLVRHVKARDLVQGSTEPAVPFWRALANAMRPYQWVKNLLVFVPLVASHDVLRLDQWISSALAFLVFSLCASGIYLLNDISDIRADRLHPRKRKRPFAAGHLSVPRGAAASTILIGAAVALASLGGTWQLAAVAVAYVATTAAYSLALKRIAVVDVFALTGLYVLRVVAGGVATNIPLSSWLLAFALFFFLSLAFVKRYSEVVVSDGWLAGRGYCQQDAQWIQSIGTSAGYMAILVLVLYINAPEVAVLYSQPKGLWLLAPLLLFWVTRMWFRAARRVITDDPVLEALRDRVSYATGVAALIVLLIAI